MTTRLIKVLTLSFTLVVTGPAFATLVFDDGMAHVISSQLPDDQVEIRDSGGGLATTVNMTTGGEAQQHLTVFDNSIFNLQDGLAQTLVMGRGSSTVTITGGSVGDSVAGFDQSVFNILGGDIGSEDSAFWNSSKLFMLGGSIEEIFLYDLAIAEITGGLVEAVFTRENAEALNMGGTIFDKISASDQSHISLTAGDIDPAQDMFARDRGVIDIYGFGFNRPFGAIADLDGVLTGNLADSSPFSIDFSRDDTAAIILHHKKIPEPGSLWLLLIAGMAGLFITKRPQPGQA